MAKINNKNILVVEDQLPLSGVYVGYLAKAGYGATTAETGAQALEILRRDLPELVLLDLQLPDMNGLDILRQIKSEHLPCATVVITANGSINTAVEAMQAGAYDFVVKPFNAERLAATVRNALERRRLERVVDTIKDEALSGCFHGFVGSSPAMQVVYRTISNVASSKATVFITGESGTGKEVCADAVHRVSPRRERPFIALNCAAIPRDLIESEIFGHAKGAFTGAVSDYEGAAARANGGTLFLDELCEMDLNLQSKLLRFIQTGTFQRVGSPKLEKVDIRIVCATNRDPQREVEEGRFREDLFYRLHVLPIHLPPLREREDDVLEIARHLLRVYAGEENKAFTDFSPEAEACIRTYAWPGNVRQLQNALRNVVVLNDGATVSLDMLPAAVRDGATMRVTAPANIPPPLRAVGGGSGSGSWVRNDGSQDEIKPLWLVEKEAIERAIQICGGNIPRAAALLELAPSTVYRKKQSWGD